LRFIQTSLLIQRWRRGADGGKLNWLGAANSTKDFMHFDLFAADQPKLVP
jgi:hypothetical protein